jgi:hypothetical protein
MSIVSGTVGAIIGGDASRKATNTQADAAKSAEQMQREMYEQNREDYAPWREAGKNALAVLQERIAAGPGDFTKSPGYDFRLAEGKKAIERSAAARTGVLGGGTEKALARYSQDYASGEYQNFLNQYYQSLTPRQSLANIGMTATTGITNSGSNAANQIAQSQIESGNAQAAGTINQANAITGNINASGRNAIAGYNAWKNAQAPAAASGAAYAGEYAGDYLAGAGADAAYLESLAALGL